ncbi:hypothetical protein F5051DRAFT_334741, partial [Lentinula edodes]
MVQDALRSTRTTAEAIDTLYGPVYADNGGIVVYLTASSRRDDMGSPQAAFSLFWGENSENNVSFRIQTVPKPTINRALLSAMIPALQIANRLPERTLHINVTSEYLVRSLCYWAADNAEHAWDCAHSDILKVVVSHLCTRVAAVEF